MPDSEFERLLLDVQVGRVSDIQILAASSSDPLGTIDEQQITRRVYGKSREDHQRAQGTCEAEYPEVSSVLLNLVLSIRRQKPSLSSSPCRRRSLRITIKVRCRARRFSGDILIMLCHSHYETDGLDDVVEERQEQNVQDEEELCTGFEPHLEQLFDVQLGRGESSFYGVPVIPA
jgi:hypothetical protein